MNTLKIFVYGMSGSGKDTIANYLKNSLGFMKLRIADTIKRIICEKCDLTFDELELQKRSNKSLRSLHHRVGEYLDTPIDIYLNNFNDNNGTTNRINQLINGTALDYQHFSDDFIQKTCKVICDVRTFEWSEQLLNAGWIGIFLTRTTPEFKESDNFTEQNIFSNGGIEKLWKSTLDKEKIIIINNDPEVFLNIYDIPFILTDGSEEKLILTVKQKILNKL